MSLSKTRKFNSRSFFLQLIVGLLVIGPIGAGLSSCTSLNNKDQSQSRDPAAIAGKVSWSLGAYLPSDLNKKVFINISEGKIVSITPAATNTGVIDTEAVVFPGLMDMHGHIKYNVLPLWDNARGQFLNRFEWRGKYSPYGAVSFNMKAYKGFECANVRWAELMSITGGTTSMQGIGNDGGCTKDFGIHNIELPDEYGRKLNARGATDVVQPALVRSVYENRMRKFIKAGQSYDQAFKSMLTETKIIEWVNNFASAKRTVADGIKLTIGLTVKATSASSPEAELKAYEPEIRAYLSKAPYSMVPSTVATKAGPYEKQLVAMATFILGKKDSASNTLKGGFITSKAEVDTGYQFVTKGGVLNLPSDVRRYYGMFEKSRQSWLVSLTDAKNFQPIVAHVAEGGPKDAYNRSEFQYLKQFDLARSGMVIVHGVGMDKADFELAAGKDPKIANISIVWSPFSNLLLYGETLDIVAAKEAKVNLLLGSDWTPTGSKNLLQELKIARRYLDKLKVPQSKISDQDLVDMATTNAAKALRLDDRLGEVKENYQADLLLVSKDSMERKHTKDPYAGLVWADSADVSLVVSEGQPLYGAPEAIEAAAKIFGDSRNPETLPAETNPNCKFHKALRLPTFGAYKQWSSYREIEQTLKTANNEWRDKASKDKDFKSLMKYFSPLVPVFACEDKAYSDRVANFVEVEIDRNRANRATERKGDAAKGLPALSDSYNPMSDTSAADDSGDDDAPKDDH